MPVVLSCRERAWSVGLGAVARGSGCGGEALATNGVKSYQIHRFEMGLTTTALQENSYAQVLVLIGLIAS